MATDQGVVRLIPNKPFCFIHRQSGDDVFCHLETYPKGQVPAEGDSVEFEVEDTTKGPRVKQGTKVKVLGKAAPVPTKPKPNNPPSNGGLLQDVQVLYQYGTEVRDNTHFELEVRPRVTKGGTALSGAQLELFCAGVSVDLPAPHAITDSNGEAPFLIWFPDDDPAHPFVLTTLALRVVVTYQGKSASFSECFPKKEVKAEVVPVQTADTKPASQPPEPEPDRLEVKIAAYPNAAGLFAVTVHMFAKGRKAKGKFALVSAELLLVVATDGEILGDNVIQASLETGNDGTLEFLLGYASSGQILVTFKLTTGFSVTEPISKAVFARR